MKNLHVPVDVYSENWDQLADGIILDGKASLETEFVSDSNKVNKVRRKGAADKIGIKKGDLIVKIGEFEVEDEADINKALNNYRPNEETKIVFERDGEQQTVKAKLGDARNANTGRTRRN